MIEKSFSLCLVPFRGMLRAHIGPSAPSLSERSLGARRSRKRVSAKPLSGHLGPGEKKKWNCNNEMLNRAMRNTGIRNGFEDIQAEFAPFRDFKLKWTRSYKWISFEVSDYLRNAPENVVESLAETIFAKMRGEGETEYSREVCDYLNSDGFLKENQGTYLKRYRGITDSPRGESIDLMDSYRRLVESGLVEDDPMIAIRWNMTEIRGRSVGRSSVLMRTVIVNPVLDTDAIPEDVLDYALYSLIYRVNLGFESSRDGDDERYEAMLEANHRRVQAEADLRRMGLSL